MVNDMEIGGMSSLYADYLTNTAQNSKANSITSKTDTDYSNASDEELMDVCKEFESYFLEQIFDVMIDTTKLFSDDEEDSYAGKMVDYFKDMAVQELSTQATEQNGIGIAKTLYEQMKRQYSAVAPSEIADEVSNSESGKKEEAETVV